MGFEHRRERLSGLLGALVRVEDFRGSVAQQGFFQGLHTGVGLKGIRNPV